MDALPSTAALLKHLHDESVRSAELVDQMSRSLDAANARIETLREDLGGRITESGMRTATAITDLAGTVRELVTVIKEDRDLEVASIAARRTSRS